MHKDYYPKSQMVTSPHKAGQLRCFVAIELPQEVKEKLAQLISLLDREKSPFAKWVNPEGIHVTLKFLGNVPANKVADIAKVLRELIAGSPSLKLQVSGLGAFPNLEQPRVIWVGLQGEIEKLEGLQHNIDSALIPLGFPQETHPFSPHLTLARLRDRASPAERRNLGKLLIATPFVTTCKFRVKSVLLMKSQLSRQGAIYSCLNNFPLNPR